MKFWLISQLGRDHALKTCLLDDASFKSTKFTHMMLKYYNPTLAVGSPAGSGLGGIKRRDALRKSTVGVVQKAKVMKKPAAGVVKKTKVMKKRGAK